MRAALTASCFRGQPNISLPTFKLYKGGNWLASVQQPHELAATGRVCDVWPAQTRAIYGEIVLDDILAGGLRLDATDWENAYGFPKPDPMQPIVFTCAAGVRSRLACEMAAEAGFAAPVNYTGGANEWFGLDFQAAEAADVDG